jgi:transposase-like protein
MEKDDKADFWISKVVKSVDPPGQVTSAVNCPSGATQRIRLSECVRAFSHCPQCTQTNIVTAAQLEASAQDFVCKAGKDQRPAFAQQQVTSDWGVLGRP